MKRSIKVGSREIVLSGLKDEIKYFERTIHYGLSISSYIKELSGIVGGEERTATLMTLFTTNECKEGYKEALEVLISELPAEINKTNYYDIKVKWNKYFDDFVCIRDERKTNDEIAERNRIGKENQLKHEQESKERENKINLFRTPIDLALKNDSQMFLTIQAFRDDSDVMSDYFNAHHSASKEYAIAVVPKGNESENKLQSIVSSIPELKELTWKWHTEKYSMGHGNYLQSSKVGVIEGIISYGGVKDPAYWYELTFNNYAPELLKSRFFVDNPIQSSEPIQSNGTIEVRENVAQNGIEILFPSKPSSEVLNGLKSNGFRWSMHNKVWYKKASDSARQYANSLISK